MFKMFEGDIKCFKVIFGELIRYFKDVKAILKEEFMRSIRELEFQTLENTEEEKEWYRKFDDMEGIANLQPMSKALWNRFQGDKVWRKVAKVSHPDVGGDPEIFKEINEAKSRRNIFTLLRYASHFGVDLHELEGCYEELRRSI